MSSPEGSPEDASTPGAQPTTRRRLQTPLLLCAVIGLGFAGVKLWSQMQTSSVAGPAVQQSLRSLPLELTTWSDWSARHPETRVLSTDTGHDRDYAVPLYAMYFMSPELMFPVDPVDERMPAKTPVLGVWTQDAQRAYRYRDFSGDAPRRTTQQLDGREFTLVYNPAASSVRIEQADPELNWMYAYWFAWYAFHTETAVVQDPVVVQDDETESER